MTMNARGARLINPVLTTVVQGYMQPTLIGGLILPPVPVRARGGQIIQFGKESFRLHNARRAPGGSVHRVSTGFAGLPFALVQDMLEGTVPIEVLEDAKEVPGIDLGSQAASDAMRSLQLTLESDQAGTILDADNYDNDHKLALSGDDKWTGEDGVPITDIRAGQEAVRSTIGQDPNTFVLSAVAFNALRDHAAIAERFKYVSKESITPQMLGEFFGFARVLVGKAVVSDAAGVLSDVWGNNAWMGYVPQQATSMQEPAFGYTYTLTGHPAAEQPYWDPTTRSWVYPVVYERKEVLTCAEAGYLIQTPA